MLPLSPGPDVSDLFIIFSTLIFPIDCGYPNLYLTTCPVSLRLKLSLLLFNTFHVNIFLLAIQTLFLLTSLSLSFAKNIFPIFIYFYAGTCVVVFSLSMNKFRFSGLVSSFKRLGIIYSGLLRLQVIICKNIAISF